MHACRTTACSDFQKCEVLYTLCPTNPWGALNISTGVHTQQTTLARYSLEVLKLCVVAL